jgi:AcrR family transcriptional regulator
MASQTPRKHIDRRTKDARAERVDTRLRLLSAALEAVVERGFDACSVDDIAARAGYSKGAFYWHFSSKDELFLALLEEVVDRPWLEAIKLLESASRERDMAPEASARFAEMLARRPLLLVQHEYISRALRDPELGARYARRQKRMRDALGQAVAARLRELGSPGSKDETRDLASAMIALVAGLSQANLIDPRFAREGLVGDIFALLYAGYSVRAARDEGTPTTEE